MPACAGFSDDDLAHCTVDCRLLEYEGTKLFFPKWDRTVSEKWWRSKTWNEILTMGRLHSGKIRLCPRLLIIELGQSLD